jgi:D-alanyl-lipoteichoic acid acyltransferase DltB (MBOAT superfamily)
VVKYSGFAVDNLNKVLSYLGAAAVTNPVSLVAPVGISFYTFQAMGYVIDVYRGTSPAERDIVRYACYASFFPTITSGPIQRSTVLLADLRDGFPTRRLWDYDRIVSGLVTILWGVFLKLVLADRLGILVDKVFGSWWMYGSVETVLAAVAYSFQILTDFAGYSEIALGSARILGFELPENFHVPYLATSIQDFWRRWHISLSTWFRDYLYFPLGGSRCSAARRYLNVLVVFVTCGIWHGVGWHYVVWGLLHGALQDIGIATRPAKERLFGRIGARTDTSSWHIGKVLVTFALVTVCWVFFRAESLGMAVHMLWRVVSRLDPWVLFDGSLLELGLTQTDVNVLLFGLAVLAVVGLLHDRRDLDFAALLAPQSMWFRWAVLLVLVVCVFVFGEYRPNVTSASFIYAGF